MEERCEEIVEHQQGRISWYFGMPDMITGDTQRHLATYCRLAKHSVVDFSELHDLSTTAAHTRLISYHMSTTVHSKLAEPQNPHVEVLILKHVALRALYGDPMGKNTYNGSPPACKTRTFSDEKLHATADEPEATPVDVRDKGAAA